MIEVVILGGFFMGKHQITVKDKENMLFLAIKNEIDGMVDTKLHSLYANHSHKIDEQKVEKECQKQFFHDLEKMFDNSAKVCQEFYRLIKHDDHSLHAKMQKEIGAISDKLAKCKSVRDLLKLQHPHLSKEDEHQIYSHALKHFKDEDFDSSYIYFSFLSLINAENPHAWVGRGMSEQNLGKYQEALASYSSALSLAPANLIVYIQIMDTLLLMKHFDEARHVYEAFMREVNPENYAHNSFILSKINVVRSFLMQSVS